MKFYIKKVILWPKDENKSIRILEFKKDKMNIITGQSQTGKSSIISIIDYCLGSGKCSIPVGVIREKVKWFGLLLELEENEILVARREPGAQIQTSEIYFLEGTKIEIPKSINKNSSVTDLKKRFNQLANLSSLDLSQESVDSYFKGNASSFRDFSAFNYQPQHIVANPYTLFFKADTYEHQEKLKAVFPLALGVVDSHVIAMKHDLKLLEKELSNKKREIESRARVNDIWKTDISIYYSNALTLGLIKSDEYAEHYEQKEEQLRRIVKTDRPQLTDIDFEISDKIINEINKLNYEETEISRNIQRYRYKLTKINEIINEKKDLEKSLEIQEYRLSPTTWLIENIKKTNNCPFCGSVETISENSLNKLEDTLIELKNQHIAINESNSILDKEIIETKKLLRQEEIRIHEIRRHKSILEEKSSKANDYQNFQSEVFRFLGKIEKVIENSDFLEINSDLMEEVERLENEINTLKTKIALVGEKEKLYRRLYEFSQNIRKYIKILNVERPDDEVKLDIKDLTLKIRSSNREDYLWEIGSGANWMGYHIGALLSLHEIFAKDPKNPVPSYLIIDQPSQVFFPDIWPGDPDPNNPTDDKRKELNIESDDIIRVNNIFKALYQHMIVSKGTQIIVIDHADEITWKDIDNINLVERWRKDNDFLIPESWI